MGQEHLDSHIKIPVIFDTPPKKGTRVYDIDEDTIDSIKDRLQTIQNLLMEDEDYVDEFLVMKETILIWRILKAVENP